MSVPVNTTWVSPAVFGLGGNKLTRIGPGRAAARPFVDWESTNGGIRVGGVGCQATPLAQLAGAMTRRHAGALMQPQR